MNGAYGGLLVVIFYGGGGYAPEQFYLISHTDLDIMTQTSQRILINR